MLTFQCRLGRCPHDLILSVIGAQALCLKLRMPGTRYAGLFNGHQKHIQQVDSYGHVENAGMLWWFDGIAGWPYAAQALAVSKQNCCK